MRNLTENQKEVIKLMASLKKYDESYGHSIQTLFKVIEDRFEHLLHSNEPISGYAKDYLDSTWSLLVLLNKLLPISFFEELDSLIWYLEKENPKIGN